MAKIKFETGQTVNFDGQPSMADIEEVAKQLGIKASQPTPTEQPVEKYGVEKGALKGVGSTLKETSGLLQSLGTNIMAGIQTGSKKLTGQETTFADEKSKIKEQYGLKSLQKGTEEEAKLKDFLTPKTTQEKIGYGAEQIAEFFIPASKVAKGQKALDVLVDGSKMSGFLKSASKVAGKAGIEALGAGSIGLAQTGDFKKAGVTAATAGIIKGVTGTAGEIMKKIKIPEKLYSRIFKSTTDDALDNIRTELNAGLQKNNPTKFADYVKAGLVKENGQINETLAREAINQGLKGSVKNMTKQTIQNTYDLELAAREAVKDKVVKLTNTKGLTKTLLDTADDWDGVAGNQISDKAINFATKAEKGVLTGDEALELKRFLDGLRIKSSFNPSAKRSLGQENYKYLSDLIRTKVRELPGMNKIMDDYRFNIEALESLSKELVKRNNQAAVSAIDTLLLGTGFATGMTPTAIAVTGLKKIFSSGRVQTGLGQAIEKSGVSSTLGIGTKGALSSGVSDLTD
jgi:hypothetical protein